MIILLSPAKSMSFDVERPEEVSNPQFLSEARTLATLLATYDKEELKKLMKLSDALAEQNYTRYQNISLSPDHSDARPALSAFKGDVYQGIDSESMNDKAWQYAQEHVRILSGLYGILKPLDLIEPYRLEMGTRLKINASIKNLYQFWQNKITNCIQREIEEQKHELVVNLASKEYSKSVTFSDLSAPVLQIHFKEWRNNTLKFISFNAKKARGQMARYLMDRQAKNKESIKGFNHDGYTWDKTRSSEWEWLFTREI